MNKETLKIQQPYLKDAINQKIAEFIQAEYLKKPYKELLSIYKEIKSIQLQLIQLRLEPNI